MIRYSVYKHTLPNMKVYIGITSQKVQYRWNNGYGYKRQPYFMQAIKKYGWDNIKHEILFENLTKEEAEQKEIEMIAFYKSNQKKYGYNIANGGNVVGTISEDTKQKISEALKGKTPKWTLGTAPWLGKHHTEETKIKLSNLRKGDKNPMYGKQISEDTKIKMSEAHKKCGLCKKIMCLETGEVFVSSAEVARIMGLSQGNVSAVANGKRKHAKGYHFEYYEKAVTK